MSRNPPRTTRVELPAQVDRHIEIWSHFPVHVRLIMKLKGIHPLEQHVEKLVVVTTAAAAAGVVGITLLTQPNAVKPDPSAPAVPPAAAFESAEREAEKLRDRLLSSQFEAPDVSKLTLSDRFDSAMQGSERRVPAVTLGDGRSEDVVAAAVVASAARYAEPSVPAPSLKGVRTYQATVSPLEWYRNKELAQLLPQAQPFDKAFVTIEGLFNGVQLREIFEADPDGDGPMAAMPVGWWRESDAVRSRDLVTIVSVEVERQLVQSSAEGTAQESVSVQGMPGRPTILSQWTSLERSSDVVDLLDRAVGMREDIERPDFFDIIAGPKWVPPSEVVDAGAEDNSRRIAVAKDRLKGLDAEIATLKSEAEKADSSSSKKQPRSTQPAGSGRGGKGGMTGGSPESKGTPSSEKKVSRESILNKIRNKEDERRRVIDSLVRLGESEESLTGVATGDSSTQIKVIPGLLESDEVRLWVHDLTAERGSAYRYRMRVVLNNPMFGRAVHESQSAMTKMPLLAGSWTEWSDPVTIDQSEYFFVTSADVKDGLNPRPRAVGEMFEFYYGYYRRATVTLEPGDVVEGEAKLPAELKFADMKKVSDFLTRDPSQLPQTVAPPPSRRGPAGPAPAMPSEADGDPSLGDSLLTEAAPKTRTLKVDAMLLDVAQTMSAGTRFIALFRDSVGTIMTRSPESDRAAAMYRKLDQSAREGADQGKVEVEAPKPEPVKRERERENRSGGGSGGGGG